MNAKKAKAIRHLVRSMGKVKAEYPQHHRSFRGRLTDAHKASVLAVPVTAKYPADLFQRIYTAAKRMLRRVAVGTIKVQTAIHIATR